MTQYLIGLTIPLEAVAITGLDHDMQRWQLSQSVQSAVKKNRHRPEIESLCCNTEVSYGRRLVPVWAVTGAFLRDYRATARHLVGWSIDKLAACASQVTDRP
jgi:hypothetical protein